MPKEINTRNPEPTELVGSTDLREVFKDNPLVRGSFYINHILLPQFSVNAPSAVVALINAKSFAHYVTAEIDDGGHLVLIDKSGAEIILRNGPHYHLVPPAPTGNTVADLIAAREHHDAVMANRDKPAPTILELLGLPATGEGDEVDAGRAGFQTGMSAKDRRKRLNAERGIEEDAPQKAPPAPPPSTDRHESDSSSWS